MLDTDGDWGATCDIETWYDKEESVYCGPDSFDANDDNDRALDIADAWPTDPCASIDTDNDGQPDDLHCPLGATTWLIADQDDDGDGIPDVLDGQDFPEESDGSGGLILLVFIVAIMLAAATRLCVARMRASRNGRISQKYTRLGIDGPILRCCITYYCDKDAYWLTRQRIDIPNLGELPNSGYAWESNQSQEVSRQWANLLTMGNMMILPWMLAELSNTPTIWCGSGMFFFCVSRSIFAYSKKICNYIHTSFCRRTKV